MSKQKINDLIPRKLPPKLQIFASYCWGFYAPGEIYGHFFDQKLTREKLDQAVVVISHHPSFCGDSFDREKVRDLLLSSKRSLDEWQTYDEKKKSRLGGGEKWKTSK